MSAGELPTQPVHEIEACTEQAWLVEHLWQEEGVGIVGGAPKSCKSWLSLDIALSVATGSPALGTFAVPRAGKVLLFAAEDAPAMVRARLAGMAATRGLDLANAPIDVIRVDVLHLDRPQDQERLQATVRRLRPRLLILDPFVRIHTADENSSQEVSRILACLRQLQRRYECAVLVVHHARKASAQRAGMALRGSGDLWAWGDSNLYLRRREHVIELQVEHRNAPAPSTVRFRLDGEATAPSLRILKAEDDAPAIEKLPLRDQVLRLLETEGSPITQQTIRRTLRVKTESLVETMRTLETERLIERTDRGWQRMAATTTATG